MTIGNMSAEIVNQEVYNSMVAYLRERKIRLPTFSQLMSPETIPQEIRERLEDIDPQSSHPLNLYRVHWYNSTTDRSIKSVPEHVILPSSLTGVEAQVVVMFGNSFPMISAHKVLAAYACLVPKLLSGEFDPVVNRAIWPSTGNYCRGGVAISKILGCRGVAILPEGMSKERFDWLNEWVMSPTQDIVRTYGTESNVKEIYDKCNELAADDANVIFNQFSEFANYISHYHCTGKALSDVYDQLKASNEALNLHAFVATTGSAGTIAAGDYLKDRFGANIVAAEPVECPTMLYNGFGEHNIQGIGDKHLPLIHNVMNTDMIVGISDRASDSLNLLFNHSVGQKYLLARKGICSDIVTDKLGRIGLSGIANILGAIKAAKHYKLGKDDVVITIATDSSQMYCSEQDKEIHNHRGGQFDELEAAEIFGQYLGGVTTDHSLELGRCGRERVFNLGYYTWVEQQGVSVEDFEQRRKPEFWNKLKQVIYDWDRMIEAANTSIGVG